jgi:uncharacterized protein with von Willebrand factor type A (vWA) domain
MSEDDYTDLRHFVAHEVSHILYTDFAPAKTGAMVFGSDSILGFLMNLIEDHRVDYLNAQEYRGDGRDQEDYHRRTAAKFQAQWDSSFTAAPAPTQERVATVAGLFAWDASVRTFGTSALVSAWYREFDTKDLVTALAPYSGDLAALRTIVPKNAGTAASWELATRIFREVFKGNVDEEAKRFNPATGSCSGVGTSGKGGAEDAEAAADSAAVVPWDKLEHNTMTVVGGKSQHGMSIDYTGYTGTSNWDLAMDEIRVVDYVHNCVPREYSSAATHLAYKPSITTSEAFAQQVRLNLQIRSRVRYEYGLKSGKLNPRALYRLGIKDSGTSRNVFKARRTNDVLNAAVSVLVDTSGSMGLEKYGHAAQSAILLNEAIGNVLHVPLEIAGFTEDNADNHHYTKGGTPVILPHTTIFLHRAFGQLSLTEAELEASLAKAADNLANNADGEAILWAYERLCKRPEKRKLLVVLSDGSPACDRSGDIVWYTKHVVQQIEAAGRAQIYGIGIMDRNVQRFYKHHQVITSAGMLEEALLTLIDRYLVE